ncbi:MAG: hypothetical protein L6R41_007783 [Letrouitia leprolyta]|nr:MAG: hypothetical protein L6R41_007783 [Letrouitia leprolyta]
MRIISVSNGFAAITILTSTATAINPKYHAFMKRQGCNNIESECSSIGTTLADCIDYVCDACTSVDPAIPECCNLSSNLDIANCIDENIGTSGTFESSIDTFGNDFTSYTGNNFAAATSTYDYGNSYTYTGSSAVTTPYLLTANLDCSSFISKFDDCASATPGFGASYFWEEQASCICYSGNSYAPSAFDTPYSSCLDVLSSSDYEVYTALTIGSEDAASTPCGSLADEQAASTAFASSADEFTFIGGGAASSTGAPATLTPSPGSQPTIGGAGSRPTSTTSSRTAPVPSAVAPGSGGASSAGSGVDALGVQMVFIGLASFAAILYIL